MQDYNLLVLIEWVGEWVSFELRTGLMCPSRSTASSPRLRTLIEPYVFVYGYTAMRKLVFGPMYACTCKHICYQGTYMFAL